mmetsp:Transcript_10543/g.20268  ORF Transcript_10543/g.20268 Transcript_10543/m.20268 type:complete len:366 (-) Transcript_10543:79-1176(-)
MEEVRRKAVLLLLAAQWMGWPQVQGQPTPPPTLFAGSSYTFNQCAIDVFQADMNNDGFISRNEEYLSLINKIGAPFCFEQTGNLTATQQSAYFTLVCELVVPCFISSEIPVSGLSSEQILKICNETRGKIFNRCPEPTASPGTPNGPPSPPVPPPSGTPRPRPPVTAPPFPSPVPPPSTPGPPTPLPPGATSAPTVPFDPVAPNVSLAQCRQDLAAADADSDERITPAEFVTFLNTFGDRVCYERDAAAALNDDESDTFAALICLATVACAGVTDIVIAEPAFTPTLAYTLCTVTYQSGMNAPLCDATGSEETTSSPTATPDDPESSPTNVPVTPRSGATDNRKGSTWTIVTVAGAAVMFSNVWM